MDEHLDYFDVNLRIVNRPGVQKVCFTDAWAVPYLLWDGEAVEEPEPAKIGYFLARVELPIVAASSPLSLFHNLKA